MVQRVERNPGKKKKDSRRLPSPEGHWSAPSRRVAPAAPLVDLLSVLSEVQCPGIPNTRKFSVLGLDSFSGIKQGWGCVGGVLLVISDFAANRSELPYLDLSKWVDP